MHKRDEKKIFTFLHESSNLNLNLQCLFGFFYLMGIGTDAYPDTAFEIFKKVAHGNDAIGKFYLGECFENGLCYLTGKGIKRNKQKAFYCFNKSYENGCISACNNLGSCYELGIFTKKNKDEAFKHYQIAAEHNILSGQNIELAKEWYKKAADNGHEDSQKKLSKLNKRGNELKKLQKKKNNNDSIE
ncbi:1002_t:CDS:2 [Dentiscutata erythropus]|uniref:1002_t:CDS:1 n=1 Tax=Dentiscutata erythropus TaxID=1348616 RepID=A0A9N9NIT8_9GLOM|nr:1002_t:CDS:2 [Dentiscutata erythropus]